MLITYFKLLLNTISISKENFNRVPTFPLQFCSSSWTHQMTKLPTCQNQRGGRYRYHPKNLCRPQGWCQLSHEKTSVQCLKYGRTMSQHHPYRIPGKSSHNNCSFICQNSAPTNCLDPLQVHRFLCWKSSVPVKKLFKTGWYVCVQLLFVSNWEFKHGCDKMWPE